MFICTANDIDNLSAPLRNRLELISISGYTQEEKFDIATKNIIPEQKKQNGVSELITFQDDAVNEIMIWVFGNWKEMWLRFVGKWRIKAIKRSST
jgi:ATP-dependent Lon protease